MVVIGAIDNQRGSERGLEIGLSAVQIYNLDLKTDACPVDKDKLINMIKVNVSGKPDNRSFGTVTVTFNGRTAKANVYNAFGRMIGHLEDNRSKIRVSSDLARYLGLKGDETVLLS